MNKKEYNGWYNYETWLANLWHDAGWEDEIAAAVQGAIENPSAHFEVREQATLTLADSIKTYIEDNIPPEVNTASFWADLINAALSEINYHDIAEHYINDIKIYSAMWNMPGCLPECDPAFFLDEDEAKEYLKDEIASAADGDENITDDEIEALQDEIENTGSATYNGYIYSYQEV